MIRSNAEIDVEKRHLGIRRADDQHRVDARFDSPVAQSKGFLGLQPLGEVYRDAADRRLASPLRAQRELHRHPVARPRRRGKGLNDAHRHVRFEHFGIAGQRRSRGGFPHDIFDPRAQNLVVRPPERPFADAIDEREAPHGVPDERDAGEVFHERAKGLFAALDLRLGGAQRVALMRLLHGALNGRGETGQVRLQHIIGCPAAQRPDRGFLADRPGDENERNVRLELANDLERGQAVEVRQGEIRQHDVGVEFVALADELSLRLDAAKVDAQAAARELAQRDLRVGFDVFDHQDSERCHGVAHSLRRSFSAGMRLTSTQ